MPQESQYCCQRSYLVMSALSLVLLALFKNLSGFQEGYPYFSIARKTELSADESSNRLGSPRVHANISKANVMETLLQESDNSRDTDFVPAKIGGFHSNDQVIIAFYYPWYGENRWNVYGTQGHHPLLGNYSSNDTAIAEQHIDWAVDRGGIDAWAVSWWNKDSAGAKRFVEGMLHAKNIAKIKFCMVYEAAEALRIRHFAKGTIALDKFISDMKYFRDSYFSYSSYLRVNGRPIVYLYISRSFENFDSSMLDVIKTAVGEDILFIADEPYYILQSAPETARNGVRNGTPVFEAYSSYNMYQFSRVNEGEAAVDYMFREALPVYDRWSRATVFFPHVLPKYHDFREGHPELVGSPEGLMKQLKTFGCLPRPSWYSNEFPNLMFVTTFNEWYEGTSVEPDVEQEYGFTYLDTIKTFKESGVWANCQDSVA